MKFYTITEFRKLCGVTLQTLRNWDKSGYLKPHHTAPNGFRYYSEEQLQQLNGEEYVNRKIIGYCLADTKEQLHHQIDSVTSYLAAQGKPFEIISDSKSGKKVGLAKLIQLVNNNEVEKITVLYPDVLPGLGWDAIKNIADLHKTKLEVIIQSIIPE